MIILNKINKQNISDESIRTKREDYTDEVEGWRVNKDGVCPCPKCSSGMKLTTLAESFYDVKY